MTLTSILRCNGEQRATMDLSYDHDSTVFQALRIYRNNIFAYCRSRLSSVPELDVDDEIRKLFQKEWAEIERSADQARATGVVDRKPVDALDYLSVNHVLALIEKFWDYLAPGEPKSDMGRRQRAQISGWAKELSGVRNPVAHSPEQELSLRDALRYIDSAARILEVLRIQGSDELRDTKENGSSWIFEPCLTWANALQRVQRSAFSLVCGRPSWLSEPRRSWLLPHSWIHFRAVNR
jgi:hypothetical protein